LLKLVRKARREAFVVELQLPIGTRFNPVPLYGKRCTKVRYRLMHTRSTNAPWGAKTNSIMTRNAATKKQKANCGETKPEGGPLPSVINADLAELLAREAEHAQPPISRALRRASRRAFLWPDEVSYIVRTKRSLTELQGIGSYLEKLILEWIASPPPVPEPPSLRTGFLTFTEAETILAAQPEWIL